jgi:hypothetical protein
MSVVGRPPAGAIVATKVSDFENVDNSLVFPRGAGPEIQNITDDGPSTFKFVLRHRGNPWSTLNPKGERGAWYDGDRDLQWNEGKRDGKYHDKSRAEVSCLHGHGSKKKPSLEIGDKWEIGTTVRLDPDFVPSRGYCNLMQPVFDQSFLNLTGIKGDMVTAQLMVFTDGIGSPIKVARAFEIRRGEWTSIRVRVKFHKNGFYRCSVNGDPFSGVDMDTTNGRQPFGPKWGLYMTATTDVTGKPVRDSIVWHRNVYLDKLSDD